MLLQYNPSKTFDLYIRTLVVDEFVTTVSKRRLRANLSLSIFLCRRGIYEAIDGNSAAVYYDYNKQMAK